MEKKIFKQLFREIFVIFLLTTLTLSLIIWILQAVNFLDIISEDGHSIATYFQYSLLNIPKIISKVMLLSFFLSLFYILVNYEENNQLLIYWTNGVTKNEFLKRIFIFSILFIIISFFLSFTVVPYTQDKARSFIRTSNLDFFPSLIKPKKFIDTVENLTIFIDEKEGNKMDNIILKDSSDVENIQLIIANNGKIINQKSDKYLILYDGKIINSSRLNKLTIFSFKETLFNLDRYKTKTTITPKIQEIKSFEIIKCLYATNKNLSFEFENFTCQKSIIKQLYQEIYKRIYLPLYIPLISIIVLFLIISSHSNTGYNKTKIKIFLSGIVLIILSQISVNLISENLLLNIATISFLPIMILLLYFLLNSKIKLSS